MDTSTIGTSASRSTLVALAREHGIPAEHLNVMEVGFPKARLTEEFLQCVAHGRPAVHPITGAMHGPNGQPVKRCDPLRITTRRAEGMTIGVSSKDEPVDRGRERATPPPRAYTRQWIDLPRDTIPVFRASHGYDKTIADAKARKSGKGRKSVMQVRELWLLATLYRMVNARENLVIVEPAVLAAASGWSLRALQDRFPASESTKVTENCGEGADESADGVLHDEREPLGQPLSPWVSRRPGQFEDAAERTVWKFDLKPVPKDLFLKVPAWWLWTEPTPGDQGAAKWKRRDWQPSSAALLVALAYTHIADHDTPVTDNYGLAGIATLCGVSHATAKQGRADAIRLGYLAATNRRGGLKKATITVRQHPNDTIGDLSPLWDAGHQERIEDLADPNDLDVFLPF